MGVERSKWIYFSENILFSQFYDGNKHLHILFGIFGLGLLLGMYIIIYQLIKLIIHIILKKVALDYNLLN